MNMSNEQVEHSAATHCYFAAGMIGFALHGLMMIPDKLSAIGYAMTIVFALCQCRVAR